MDQSLGFDGPRFRSCWAHAEVLMGQCLGFYGYNNVGCSITIFICLIIVIEQPPFIVIDQPPFVLNKQDKNIVIAIEIINI